MAKRDYYDVLGIGREATKNEIKHAYRKLAVKFHPDRNDGDESAAENFREATEAYEVLKDEKRKARYDQFGHAAEGGGFGGGHPFGGGGSMDLNDALESFLRNFGGFGGMGGMGGMFDEGGGSQRRGRDLQIRVEITLAEVAKGVTRKIKIRKQVACPDCKGSGAAAGSRPVSCSQCGGHGRVRQIRQSMLGRMVTEGVCPACGGRGQVVTEPCRSCNGTGTIRGEETISVKIPVGVTTGNYMELNDRGDFGGQGAANGDLRVLIEVAEDDLFERHGDDILIDVPVSAVDLMLGTRIKVPLLDGKVALKIPAGTQSHKIFRMRGKGIPRLNHHGIGDQLVRIIAWTPQALNADQQRVLDSVRENLNASVPDPGSRFFD